ncbi:MAG: hypothetical protein A2Y40_01350 [Candidatus Margulisbacteria bacterium GWF2_35_9]|nr:MAG: hypothetical protein A2Y40_01350 [Candidatus Margulisbacteria bacterium GWF2_35_9]
MITDKQHLEKDISDLLNKYATGTLDKQQLLKDFILSTVLYNWEDPEPEEIIPLKEGLDEIRNSIAMFKKFKYNFKISIFGSARTPIDDDLYKLTVEFSQKAAQYDFKIITGGGPGIMAAGNIGAGPENSFGLGLKLPFENNSEVFDNHPHHLTVFKHFYSRKLTFYRESQAIVVMPGGYGTMDEIFQGLASIQTGKINIRPFVLLDKPGGQFWYKFNEWVEETLGKDKYIDEDDLRFYSLCYSSDDALAVIKQFYKHFFSYFILDNRLFFQLKIKLNDQQLSELNNFAIVHNFSEFCYIRERYFNFGTLHVYSCQINDSHYCTSIRKAIDIINNFQ